MKNSIKYIGLFVLATCMAYQTALAQEDFQGSQFLFDKTYINPAFTSIDSKLNLDTHYQIIGPDQGIGNSYAISAAAGLQLDKKNGLGVNIVRTVFGSSSYAVGYINYVYHLPVTSELVLSSSLGLGVQQFNINLSNAVTAVENDPLASGNVYNSGINGRFGLVASVKSKYYFGVSFDNILSHYNKRDEINDPVPLSFQKISMYLISGVNLVYDSGLSFEPSIMYIKNFGGLNTFDINTMLTYKNSITLGLGFRQSIETNNGIGLNKNEINRESRSLFRPMIQYQINTTKNLLKIGYCYNFNANRSVAIGRSSHDISVVFSIPEKN